MFIQCYNHPTPATRCFICPPRTFSWDCGQFDVAQGQQFGAVGRGTEPTPATVCFICTQHPRFCQPQEAVGGFPRPGFAQAVQGQGEPDVTAWNPTRFGWQCPPTFTLLEGPCLFATDRHTQYPQCPRTHDCPEPPSPILPNCTGFGPLCPPPRSRFITVCPPVFPHNLAVAQLGPTGFHGCTQFQPNCPHPTIWTQLGPQCPGCQAFDVGRFAPAPHPTLATHCLINRPLPPSPLVTQCFAWVRLCIAYDYSSHRRSGPSCRTACSPQFRECYD